MDVSLNSDKLSPWMRKMQKEAWDEALKRAAAQKTAQYQADPVKFGNEVLEHHYYSDVEALMQSVVENPITIAKSANAVGKTYSAADIALWWFLSFDDAEVYVTAAPPLENLKNLLWGEMIFSVRSKPDLFQKYSIKELEVKRHDKSAIHGVTIPMTGTREERVAKFCADADDLFELYDGSVVRYSELVGKKDIPVVSVDRELNRQWSKAEFFDNGEQLVYELKLEDGQIVRRTGNHPLYAGWDIRNDYNHALDENGLGRGRIRALREGWLSIDKLRDGFAVLCPDNTSFNFGTNEINENTLKWLAYMIGDGCFRGKENKPRLQFTQARNAQLEEYLAILDDGNIKHTVSDKKKYNWVCVSVYDKSLVEFVRNCGLLDTGSEHKFVPGIIFGLRKEQIAVFLNRLFSTDGWACMNKCGNYEKAEIGYASKSERLIRDVHRLLYRFGIHAKITSKVVRWTHNNEKKSGLYWSLFINNAVDIERFYDEIGIFGKEESLNTCVEFAENRAWTYAGWKLEKPGYRWKRIKSINIVGVKQTVGVCVPGDSTYLTSLVEHNSGKHSPHLLFIVDEGDAVPHEVYEGIEGCMSGGMARLLIMFNPKAQSGPVYQMELEQKARLVNLSALRHPNVITGQDIIPGAVTRETVVRRINQWTRPVVEGEEPSPVKRFEIPDFLIGTTANSLQGIPYPPLEPGVRVIMDSAFSYMVLGQYPEQGENQLISQDWIKKARERWDTYVAEFGERPPQGRPRLGLDVAEFGQDFNAPVLRYGDFVPRIERIWQGVDPTVTGERAAEICRQKDVGVILVDGTGYGSSVAPQISKMTKGIRCVSVKVAGKPSPMITSELGEFFQIRDQLWWACREWLRESDAMLPPEPMLLEELMTPTYRINDRGKIQVSSKDDLRAKLKRSSNYADALMLTFLPAERAKVIRLSD